MDKQKIQILLLCGSGASSGFMATNIMRAAKERGIDLKAIARSVNELESYIDEVDLIMIGPHMIYIKDEVEVVANSKNIPLCIIDRKSYMTLDGKGVLNQIIEILN